MCSSLGQDSWFVLLSWFCVRFNSNLVRRRVEAGPGRFQNLGPPARPVRAHPISRQSIRSGRRRRRVPAGRRIGNDCRADILQQPLEFGRSEDDRSRRGAQAIHRLGGQHKSRGLAIQVGQLLLVLQRGKRHVDGVDLCGRCAYRRAKRRAPSPRNTRPGCGSAESFATAPRCLSTARPPRRKSDRWECRRTSAVRPSCRAAPPIRPSW